MCKDYFVMLNTQSGGMTPLVEGYDDGLATFDTLDEAKAAGNDNLLGEAFGFEVFRRGEGY